MRRTAVFILFGLALALAACQGLKPDPAALSASQTVFDELRTGQVPAILAQLPPQANTPAMAASLAKLHTMLPPDPPRSSKLVNASTVDAAGAGRSQVLVREYDYADRAALFETRFQAAPGSHDWKLRAFHLQVATHKQLAVNTFSFDGKTPAELIFFALAITSPLLMVIALVKVIRTKGLTRKWLWGIVCFLGLFTFQINWATGALLVQWTTFQIFGFGLISSPSQFDPWFIRATLPAGALLILAGLIARPSRTPGVDA
jgi:hypothetical protein